MVQPDPNQGDCIAMVPITSSYSPLITIPCNETFSQVSYVCVLKPSSTFIYSTKKVCNRGTAPPSDQRKYCMDNTTHIRSQIYQCPKYWTQIDHACYAFSAVRCSNKTAASSSVFVKFQKNSKYFMFFKYMKEFYQFDRVGIENVVHDESQKSTKHKNEADTYWLCVKSPAYEPSICLRQHFVCNNVCIASIYVCDHVVDCTDATDEADCQVMCVNNGSPAEYEYCKNDCHIRNCYCTDGNFQCTNGGCLAITHVCDGRLNCADGSDEGFCNYEIYKAIEEVNIHLLKPLCIYMSNHDFLYKPIMSICTYEECSRSFKCSGSYCLSLSLVCDGMQQCPLGDDEDDCNIVKCDGLFRCRTSSICIHPDNVCDGVNDCVNADDEVLCQPIFCPRGCQCWGYFANCSHGQRHMIPVLQQETKSLVISDNFINTLTNVMWPRYLSSLNLHCNQMMRIDLNTDLSVTQLDLSSNKIEILETNSFRHLQYLRVLLLSANPVHSINKYAFNGLIVIQFLNLKQLHIEKIHSCAFCGVQHLEVLDLGENRLTSLETGQLSGLRSIGTLRLDGNEIKSIDKGFVTATRLDIVHIDQMKWCCYFPSNTKCIYEYTSHLLSSCGHLIGSNILKAIIWVEAAVIFLFGTIEIVFLRSKLATKKKTSLHLSGMISLAISDILIVGYLIVIGIADIQYKGVYIVNESKWKSSILCKGAAIATLLSVQTSIIVLFLMSLEKYWQFARPFSKIYISQEVQAVSLSFIWIACSAISIILVFLLLPVTNGMCFILDFQELTYSNHTTERIGKWFLFFTVILDTLMLIFIIAFNITSIRIITRSRSQMGRTKTADENSLVVRTILVSVSNFLSWAAIIPIAGMSLLGYRIKSDLLAWVSIVGLPANSILNPVLYTFTTKAFHKAIQQARLYYSTRC